ncbi:MAG: MFS transporter [Ktedonobacteraceae bacterium]
MAFSISLKERSRTLASTLHPLSEKNFSIFWAGAFLSSTGFWIQTVGQGWQVLQLTHSALLLGLVTLAATIPNLLFSLFGGVLVDRWDRRSVLFCTQAIYMTTALLLGILTTLHSITVWEIFIAALVNGIVSAVGLPAWQTFVTDLVPSQELRQGVALDFMQFNLSRAVGPALGGLSVGLVGIAGSYYLNSVSYIAVLLSLLLVHAEHERHIVKRQSILQGLGEGLQYVRQHLALQLALLLQFLLAFLVFPFATLLPIFAATIFRIGAPGLGMLNAVTGMGALTGALLFLLMSQHLQRTLRLMILLCMLGGSACVALAFAYDVWLALPALVILGICSVLPLVVTNTAIQVMTPEGMRGRILSIRILITFGLAPFGNLLVGWVAQSIGVQMTLALSGGLCLLFTLIVAVLHIRHRIELV